jgi:hypothetical protein
MITIHENKCFIKCNSPADRPDIINKYSFILNGEITSLLLNTESINSFPKYLEMAKLGLLTCNSQEGIVKLYDPATKKYALSGPLMSAALSAVYKIEDNDKKEPTSVLKARVYESIGRTWGTPLPTPHIYKERAYVQGLMHIDAAQLFIDVFNHKDKIAYFNESIIHMLSRHKHSYSCISEFTGLVASKYVFSCW